MENQNKQFVYVLRPIPRLLDEKNWTEKENAVVADHFAVLQKLHADGKLILAGKTDGLDEHTFGLVIFEADSEEEAKAVMNGDPAVAQGVMTAELYPYHVAITR